RSPWKQECLGQLRGPSSHSRQQGTPESPCFALTAILNSLVSGLPVCPMPGILSVREQRFAGRLKQGAVMDKVTDFFLTALTYWFCHLLSPPAIDPARWPVRHRDGDLGSIAGRWKS